eukprot:6214726-Pleurochrysis_carterae.AAC.3
MRTRRNANIRDAAVFTGYTTFDGADLTGSQITDSSLPGVSFRGAILKDLAVQCLCIPYVRYRQAYGNSPIYFDPSLWFAWALVRSWCKVALTPPLFCAEQEDSYFSDGDFTGAVFKGIRFRDGSVEHANFENADLGEGNFEAVNTPSRCVFEEANLRGANLRRAILTETNMQCASPITIENDLTLSHAYGECSRERNLSVGMFSWLLHCARVRARCVLQECELLWGGFRRIVAESCRLAWR